MNNYTLNSFQRKKTINIFLLFSLAIFLLGCNSESSSGQLLKHLPIAIDSLAAFMKAFLLIFVEVLVIGTVLIFFIGRSGYTWAVVIYFFVILFAKDYGFFMTVLLFILPSIISYWVVPKLYSKFNNSYKDSNIESQYNMGTKYFKQNDFEKAKYWFEKAAENGDVDSQYQLGNIHLQGMGTQKDMSKALYWYEKAALNNHSQSQHNMGMFYMQGEVVNKDEDIAHDWFKKAAENGYGPAIQIMNQFNQ